VRGAYAAQRVVPCECGSRDAYWHGPENGTREYACDPCWERIQAIRALWGVRRPCCANHARYLGGPCSVRS
jgi:hypothetical protein